MQIVDFTIVVFISYIAECLYTVFLSVLFSIFSPMWIIFLGVSVSSTVIFLSSYLQDPMLFCWVYGVSLGILSATVFLPSTIILWEKLPEHKGTNTGILLTGYYLGPGILGLIFTYLTNPNNYSAEEVHDDGKEQERYFDTEITDSVPGSLRWTAIIYIVSAVIGLICLNIKSNSERSSETMQKVGRTITFVQMIRNGKVWYFFALMFLGLSCSSYIIVTYKIIGVIHINDDHFLSYVGTTMFFCGAGGRFVFGIFLDIFSHKKLMMICYALITGYMIVLGFCLDNRYLYGFIVIAILFTSSGIYNGILLEMDKIFPNDKWIISIVCLSMILDFFFPFLAEGFITPEIGYFYTFAILGGFSFISMVLVLSYNDQPDSKINLL